MPKGGGTKQCITLQYLNGTLYEIYRGLMAASVVECNVNEAVLRLRAGGKVYLENRGNNLDMVKEMIGEKVT